MSEESTQGGAAPVNLNIGPSTADLVAEMESFGEADPATAYLNKQAKGEETKDAGEPEKLDGNGEAAEGDEVGTDGNETPDGDAEPDAEEEAPAEEESEGDEPAEDPPDPVAAKRIEAIQKAEKESKARLVQERTEAERLLQDRHREWESEWKPKVEKVERVEKLIERADIDPVAFADERGWSKEQKLHAAEQLYLDAKAEEDPKYRAQRAIRLRERETSGKASALEKQLAETNAKLERFEQERREEKFVSKATTAVTEKTPILKAMLTKNPEAAEARIRAAASYIRQQTGRDPDPSDVISKLEEVERSELIARGVDPDKVFPKAPPKAKPNGTNGAATKPKTQEAGERKTAKTAAVKTSTTPPPDKPPPTRDQLLQELEALDRN